MSNNKNNSSKEELAKLREWHVEDSGNSTKDDEVILAKSPAKNSSKVAPMPPPSKTKRSSKLKKLSTMGAFCFPLYNKSSTHTQMTEMTNSVFQSYKGIYQGRNVQRLEIQLVQDACSLFSILYFSGEKSTIYFIFESEIVTWEQVQC